jgi:hypothetical protein
LHTEQRQRGNVSLDKKRSETRSGVSERVNEERMRASSKVRDASDTLSQSRMITQRHSNLGDRLILGTQRNLQQITMIPDSEFIGLDTPSSTSADEDELTSSTHRKIP